MACSQSPPTCCADVLDCLCDCCQPPELQWLRLHLCSQGKQLEAEGASELLSVSVQPADPSTTQAAQRARHMLATSKVQPRHPARMRQAVFK